MRSLFAFLILVLALSLFTGAKAAVPENIDQVVDLFPAQIDIATDALGAHSIESADLDNDGDLDLISASRQDGRLRWYRSEGDPPSFVSVDIDTIPGAYIAVPGDIDGDGDMDIAVAAVSEVRPSSLSVQTTSAGTVLWYENDGTASFSQHIIFNDLDYPVSIHLADLDRDDDLDLLSASRDDNRVLWYENDGDRTAPSFTPYTLTDTAEGAVSVSTADFDGDGDLDVVSASEDDDQIAWYENVGPQPLSFITHVIQRATSVSSEFDYAKSVQGADVDGDGDMDIVYGSENNNLLGWYENRGGQPLQFVQHTVATESDHAKYVTAADVDLDGDIDLFVASTGDNTVAWYENDGTDEPGFSRHVITSQALGARYVHVVDVDGDGDMDVLIVSRFDNRITWHQNRTIHRSALFTASGVQAVTTGADWMDAATGDLDKDGHTDVVVLGENVLSWHQNNGETVPDFSQHTIADDIVGGQQIEIVDLNQDGRSDVLFIAGRGETLGWYERDGSARPSFLNQIIDADAGAVMDAEIVDFDGDGDLDVATVGTNGVRWYRNRNGTQIFALNSIDETAAETMAIVDLDRNGRPDLVTADDTQTALIWHKNQGGSPLTFTAIPIVQGLAQVSALRSGDLDGDGDDDLLSLAGDAGNLSWHENRGGQTPSFASVTIDSGLAADAQLQIADLDQDGDLDILSASDGNGDYTVVWYEHNGANPPGFTRWSQDGIAARPVAADDLDGDSDPDLVAIRAGQDAVQWIDNGGGQYSASAYTSSPRWSSLSQPIELASLELYHRGHPGDSAMVLSDLVVHFRDSDGRFLTAAQVQQRYDRFYLYRDRCCDGVYDPEGDLLAAQVSAASTSSDGQVVFDLVAGDPGSQIGAQETATYFLAATLSDICDIGTYRYLVSFDLGDSHSDSSVVDALTGNSLRAESSASGIPIESTRDAGAGERPNSLLFNVMLPLAYGVPGCVR